MPGATKYVTKRFHLTSPAAQARFPPMADGSAPQRKPRVDTAARRAEYIDVAARVMLEKGLHGATMRDFAEAAGAAKILF